MHFKWCWVWVLWSVSLVLVCWCWCVWVLLGLLWSLVGVSGVVSGGVVCVGLCGWSVLCGVVCGVSVWCYGVGSVWCLYLVYNRKGTQYCAPFSLGVILLNVLWCIKGVPLVFGGVSYAVVGS